MEVLPTSAGSTSTTSISVCVVMDWCVQHSGHCNCSFMKFRRLGTASTASVLQQLGRLVALKKGHWMNTSPNATNPSSCISLADDLNRSRPSSIEKVGVNHCRQQGYVHRKSFLKPVQQVVSKKYCTLRCEASTHTTSLPPSYLQACSRAKHSRDPRSNNK